MLVQFSFKNVLSFKDETVLDMTAVNAYKEHLTNVICSETKEKLLKVAAIYGANASGKSNLNLAMNCFQHIIIESFNNVDKEEKKAIEKYYKPFLFDEDKENSEFQIIEISDAFEYKYGFEYNADCIVSEWLYRKNLKTNRNTIILERENNKIEFGATVRKECETYQNQIPTETLALSFFNKLKLTTDIFNVVYDGIMDTLVAGADFYQNNWILHQMLPKVVDNEKTQLIDFLVAIDTGIKDIRYEKEGDKIKFFTSHADRHANLYDMNLFNESAGTIKSIIVYMYAKLAIRGNKSMFVDELNVKLHPLLLKFIIDLFYDEESTAQLIYTTHDTTLMDKKFFRRDQIWFVQKDEFGYSELSALSDFKVRSDASFEKDYLAGVYGGIPLLKELNVKEGE